MWNADCLGRMAIAFTDVPTAVYAWTGFDIFVEHCSSTHTVVISRATGLRSGCASAINSEYQVSRTSWCFVGLFSSVKVRCCLWMAVFLEFSASNKHHRLFFSSLTLVVDDVCSLHPKNHSPFAIQRPPSWIDAFVESLEKNDHLGRLMWFLRFAL